MLPSTSDVNYAPQPDQENGTVAHVALTSRQRQLKEAQKESDDAEMKLKVQQENKKQLSEHNSQSQVKLETAPDSSYCTDILVKQSSEICQDASDLEFCPSEDRRGHRANLVWW
ncbi:hypothetical protein BASA61_009545 [Batrachochytrium salamandrivorans]|nr:hypothetical protein BASA61_009545 [Batrachochytrium salamandrivorans]